MTLRRLIVRAVCFAVCAAGLQACSGPYGPHGDKGLPPPPTNMAYPNVYAVQPDGHARLKTAAEQKQLQADLLAKKRPPRARRPS